MSRIRLGPEDAALVLKPKGGHLVADVHLPEPEPGAKYANPGSSIVVAMRLRLQHDEKFVGEMLLWLSEYSR